MVNQYLKEISGQNFTTKDFSTWSGTLFAFTELKKLIASKIQAAVKKNIVAALDAVATHLGNTRTVCKKYYIHPIVISLYENNRLDKYFQSAQIEKTAPPGLSVEEKIMMKIMKKESSGSS